MANETKKRRPALRRVLVAGGIAAALAATTALWLTGEPESGALLRPGDRDIVTQGAAIYRANCASCHGVDLEGEPDWRTPGADGLMPAPPHDATGHTWHHPDALLFAITKYGVARAANLPDHGSAMPAYEGVLTDEEIIAVLSYIKSAWPEPVRRQHDEINRRFAEQRR